MKNGFTLIELLAVIVILAIIALIAVPIVINIIKDSMQESNERSIENYGRALENAVVQYQLKENKVPTKYEEIEKYIDYDGVEIKYDNIYIYEDGTIYLEGIKSGNLTKNYGKKQHYDNGTEMYFDVVNGVECTNYDVDNSKTGYNGLENTKTTDNQNSCLKFYVFNDTGKKTINLLLDHNTTDKVAWRSAETNSTEFGPTDVVAQLKIDTDGWNGTIPQENYHYYKGSKIFYTIRYNTEEYKYKARLVTAQEIAQIVEKKDWIESVNSSSFYIEGWLSSISKNNYWTASVYPTTNLYAWVVSSNSLSGGWEAKGYIALPTNGVRPVITILKSDFLRTT